MLIKSTANITLITSIFTLFIFSGCSNNDDSTQEINIEETIEEPFFNLGENPKPEDKMWGMVTNLSDEFEGENLNTNKWGNLSNTWIGRPPGIFKEDAVSVKDGNLQISNYLLTEEEVVNGNTFTHAGGLVRSLNAAEVGMYFECRMKASKTFMSSTFWLINTRNEGEGCDVRTIELDIQECIGEVTSPHDWARDFEMGMHSNTHSRETTCDTTIEGSQAAHTAGEYVWENYHIYGAWWKSPTEILFFLDGNLTQTVTTVEQFNLPMYLRLVTETYDWNPVPADGGLNGSLNDRTTRYDWVRTWQLN